jgi:hypothetical protein
MPDTEKSTVPFDAEKDLPAPLADAIRNGSVDKTILQHAGDADEALKAFMSHPGEVIELDEATNKRLLRKIDWNLMPVHFSCFCFAVPPTLVIMLTAYAGHVYRLRIKLPGQDDVIICLRHGLEERHTSTRIRLPMAEFHVRHHLHDHEVYKS